jgi:hypothetical protein
MKLHDRHKLNSVRKKKHKHLVDLYSPMLETYITTQISKQCRTHTRSGRHSKD